MLKRHKFNEKKILHKIGKHWCIISIALLGLMGGMGVSQQRIHAQDVSTQQQTNPVEQQSTQMHQQLIQSSANNNDSASSEEASIRKVNKNPLHYDTGKITQMTVNYIDNDNTVGTYQYQGPDNEMPGVNTRDDVNNHIPNGYVSVDDTDHLSSDFGVQDNKVHVLVNKVLTDKINLTSNNKPIYTMWNQGGSDKSEGTEKDFLMDSLHTRAENALKNHQSVKFFVPTYDNGKETRLNHLPNEIADDNYQANPQGILDSINQQYGSNPQEYSFNNSTINIPVVNVPQPKPQPSDDSDASDFYHTITVNYVDKNTNQKIGNSYVDSGENDEMAMPFSLINGTMTHVPSGYHYLYMQQPQFNPIPKQETLTATVEKNPSQNSAQPQPSIIQPTSTNNVDMSSYNDEINNLRTQVSSYSNEMNQMRGNMQSLESDVKNVEASASHASNSRRKITTRRHKRTAKKNYRLPRTNSKYWNRTRHLNVKQGFRVYQIHASAHHKNKILKSKWIKPNQKVSVIRYRKSNKAWVVSSHNLRHYKHYYWIYKGDTKNPNHFKFVK